MPATSIQNDFFMVSFSSLMEVSGHIYNNIFATGHFHLELHRSLFYWPGYHSLFFQGDKGDFRLSEIKKEATWKAAAATGYFHLIVRPATGHFHFCYGLLSLCKKSHDLLRVVFAQLLRVDFIFQFVRVWKQPVAEVKMTRSRSSEKSENSP